MISTTRPEFCTCTGHGFSAQSSSAVLRKKKKAGYSQSMLYGIFMLSGSLHQLAKYQFLVWFACL